jgi:hypothetical protein
MVSTIREDLAALDLAFLRCTNFTEFSGRIPGTKRLH